MTMAATTVSPTDRLRAAADTANLAALYADGRASDLRTFTEGTEDYLERLAASLRRAGYVVHAPDEPACVPAHQLEAALAVAEDALAALETPAPVEPPPVARERRSVPLPTAGSIAARLLAAYATAADGPHPVNGLTAREAETAWGLGSGSWKRVSDLVTLGLVEPVTTTDGQPVTRAAGIGRRSRSRVWAITPAGRDHLTALAGGDRG